MYSLDFVRDLSCPTHVDGGTLDHAHSRNLRPDLDPVASFDGHTLSHVSLSLEPVSATGARWRATVPLFTPHLRMSSDRTRPEGEMSGNEVFPLAIVRSASTSRSRKVHVSLKSADESVSRWSSAAP